MSKSQLISDGSNGQKLGMILTHWWSFKVGTVSQNREIWNKSNLLTWLRASRTATSASPRSATLFSIPEPTLSRPKRVVTSWSPVPTAGATVLAWPHPCVSRKKLKSAQAETYMQLWKFRRKKPDRCSLMLPIIMKIEWVNNKILTFQSCVLMNWEEKAKKK